MKGIYPNSFHWGMLSNNWSANKMNSSCEMKSSGHEFLNTHYKNHSRYIIFPSRPTIIVKELNMGIKEKQPTKKNSRTHMAENFMGQENQGI